MDFEAAIKPFCGKAVEVHIEDLAGQDPIAPPRTFELLRVKMVPEGTHLKCYMNLTQHISIPVFTMDCTRLEINGLNGTRFISEDHKSQLVYTLVWK